jgi:MFS family permease
MMNGLQTLTSWQETFNHPRGGTLGLFNAIQTIGTIVGLPFAPYVSDKLGRRAGITLGAIIMVIGTILQTAAQNMVMFIVARALIGCGCSFSAIASPVLVTELAFPSHRAPLTSMYNSSWYLGSIIAGVSRTEKLAP